MEHKLIQGGESFLPFARSRIKALKATGLKYASQKFEIDGVSVKVRIAAEHEYIAIEGGEVLLQMDSGIVDVGIINDEDPARYLPGTLTKSDLVLGYDAPFSTPKEAPWWVYPSKVSQGQFSGEISAGKKFSGKVRKDGVAKSFTPKLITEGDPPEQKPDPADEDLVFKKKASDACPPSMFTGRARLYAQAMFGQYLYDSKSQTVGNKPPELAAGLVPSLILPLSKDKNKERADKFKEAADQAKQAAIAAGFGLVYKDPYTVTLNINSGVFLDKTSGKHWLINPEVGSVKIYELISSTAGEQLRKWLRPNLSTKLSEEDREHLEAYILAACRPRVETSVTLAISYVNPYSMGYGWHWNWSGTQADMVQNLAIDVPYVGCMSSTHYRLAVQAQFDAESRDTTWTASVSTVEGPVTWSTVRPICCITEPTWANRQTLPGGSPIRWSMKTTSVLSPLFECDAPFYAFYKKDALQVCRSKAVRVAAEAPYLRYSSGYAIRTNPSNPNDLGYTVEYVTLGDRDGYVEKSTGYSEHWVLTLSCGGDATSVTYGKFKYNNWTETTDKVPTGFPLPSVGSAGPYVGRYEYGEPLPDGTWAFVDRYGYESFSVFSGYSFKVSSRSEVYSHPGVVGFIVPFYDAEAVYLVQNKQDELLKNNRDEEFQGASFHQYNTWGDLPPSTASQQYRKTYANRGTSSGPRTILPDEITVSNEVEKTEMVHRVGVTESATVTDDAMSLFAAPEIDYVFAEFKTLTSASFTNPVICGMTPGGYTIGATGTFMRPVFVGWA